MDALAAGTGHVGSSGGGSGGLSIAFVSAFQPGRGGHRRRCRGHQGARAPCQSGHPGGGRAHGGGWPSASALHCSACRRPGSDTVRPRRCVGAVALAVVAAVGLRVAAGQLPDFSVYAAVLFTAILVGLDIDAPRSASSRTIESLSRGPWPFAVAAAGAVIAIFVALWLTTAPGSSGVRGAGGHRRRHGRHQAARRRWDPAQPRRAGLRDAAWPRVRDPRAQARCRSGRHLGRRRRFSKRAGRSFLPRRPGWC